MKKNILVFGSIAGIIASTFMFISMYLMGCHGFEGSMLIGYASMLVAFAFIFVAIKNYRDKYNNGLISFGKAFTIGILVALIGSTFYVVTWAFEYNFVMHDFMEKYSANMLGHLKESGASQAAIDQQMVEINHYKELYKNPLLFTLFTYLEIFPVGIIVTLIAALILKRKDKSQLQTT